MLTINSKTLVCLFISFVLIAAAGLAGLFVGANNRLLLPSSLQKFLPKIQSDKIFLPSEMEKKPVLGVYLQVAGQVKKVSTAEITVESGSESIALKVGVDSKFFKLTKPDPDKPLTAEESAKPLAPAELTFSQIKVGNKVSVAAIVQDSSLVVNSLAVTED